MTDIATATMAYLKLMAGIWQTEWETTGDETDLDVTCVIVSALLTCRRIFDGEHVEDITITEADLDAYFSSGSE